MTTPRKDHGADEQGTVAGPDRPMLDPTTTTGYNDRSTPAPAQGTTGSRLPDRSIACQIREPAILRKLYFMPEDERKVFR